MRIRAKESYKNSAGNTIPGVTTALNELNKPALVKWANNLGLQGIDSNKYRDVLADVGTLTHYFIICRLANELPEVDEFTPEQVSLVDGCFRKYLE